MFFKIIWNYLSAASIPYFFATFFFPIFRVRYRTPSLPSGVKYVTATWCKGNVNNVGNL